MQQDHLRNIAIIAHVDHGKTTLVDAILKQTATFAAHAKENAQTTIMDSNELERERGVTILAKNTAVFWHDYKINIIDTPGHADFGGEVERVLSMADGCILLVDAAEGVLSQTRFVLRLALERGLIPIVLINKVDRKDQRTSEVENEVADLFLELATNESQLVFPTIYARGIEGVAGFKLLTQPDHSQTITDSQDLTPLFETIISTVPAPSGSVDGPLQLQVTSLDYDDYKGQIAIGRVQRGVVRVGQTVAILSEGEKPRQAKIEYVFVHTGLERLLVSEVQAGDIVAVAGLSSLKIGDTLTAVDQQEALPPIAISEPTVKLQISVNTSPFAGKEGKFSTSRQLRDRLNKELETNVALRLWPAPKAESVVVAGRGELHLSILIETMRREGYEFSVSRPQVVLKEVNGQQHEPWEKVTIDVPVDRVGVVTAGMAVRRGVLVNVTHASSGARFEYEIATANLIGFRSELLTATSGEGVLHSIFLEYRPMSARVNAFRGGAIIAHETGMVTAYSLDKAQVRGTMLVDPSEQIYAGQVVGINKRPEDMVMNIVKGRPLTNVRAASADTTVVLTPSWKPSLEQFLSLIGDDEVLEVTPAALRLRKLANP